MSLPKCNFCKKPLTHTFVDLGVGPLVDSYLQADDLGKMEKFYPLHTYVCESCFLVQLPESVPPQDLFSDYPYFSSISSSWLEHARKYANKMINKFALNENRQVIEIASNDGYLLQYFQEKKVSVLGIEPAQNIAKSANTRGINTISKFFGKSTAEQVLIDYGPADLLVGNNVLAHVPDLVDFISGMKLLLAESGIITMEFPHLMRFIDETQFDMIFHEHFSYLSFLAVNHMFAKQGLNIFDVEEVPTHGGSLRIYACHDTNNSYSKTDNISKMIEQERLGGLENIAVYSEFSNKVYQIKYQLLEFLIKAKLDGCSIVGYGAAGKAVTMLHYCGVGADFLDYVVDKSPHKQQKYMPGCRLPIYAPEYIYETKPDYVLILPWNLKLEIMQQMKHIKSWGGKFVTSIPELKVW